MLTFICVFLLREGLEYFKNQNVIETQTEKMLLEKIVLLDLFVVGHKLSICKKCSICEMQYKEVCLQFFLFHLSSHLTGCDHSGIYRC